MKREVEKLKKGRTGVRREKRITIGRLDEGRGKRKLRKRRGMVRESRVKREGK